MTVRHGSRLILVLASLLFPPGLATSETGTEPETVDLVPSRRTGFSANDIFAPVTGLFLGGPNYWYKQREIRVDTTPPGALLDLFYIRGNRQKRYEQAEAPVIIRLPSRVEAGPRDSVTIRAMLDGHKQVEHSLRVRSRETELMLDLSPLPNSLVALSHIYLAGRGSLTFLTKEALTFRLQKRDDGIQVVLTDTAETPRSRETLAGVKSALVSAVRSQQLGEDLVLRVILTQRGMDGVETRSRQGHDPIRNLHSFALDLVPADGGAQAVNRARAAFARVGPPDVSGCALRFDDAVREQLDPAALSRALSPRGAFTDPYLRAGLKRLGEVSPGGVIQLTDGSTFRPAVPIELSAAASQAAEVRGYLALLRSFVAELEPSLYRQETLRGLIAPELPPSRFGAVIAVADTRERSCAGL